jgi:hypothetical protein
MDHKPLDLDPKSANRKVRVARAYSNIISPPVVSAAMGFSVAWVGWPFWQGLVWAAIYGVMTSLLPMGVVLYMLKKGLISDLHISNRRERHIPYIVGVICSVVAVAIVTRFGGSQLMRSLAVCNAIGLAALGSINAGWQISNHTASIMAATIFLGLVFGTAVSFALLPLVGMTFVARWWLRRHTVAQLIAGMLVGAAPILVLANLGYIN